MGDNMIDFNCNKSLCAGTHINVAIKKALEIAREENEDVNFTFNGINFVIKSVDDECCALKKYNEISNEEYEKWKNSDEGKRQERERKERIENEKGNIRKLLSNPPNFCDEMSVLDWLMEIENCNSVYIYGNDIIKLFEKNGYISNVNCGEDYNKDDKDNVLRYIVGQALDGIDKVGAIHPVLTRFVEDFKRDYCKDN